MNKVSKALSIIIIILLFIILGIVIHKKVNKNEYDVSFMHEVTVSEALDIFEKKGTFVLMVGYKKCKECQNILPAIKDAQVENSYMTQYLDIEKVNRSSNDWEALKIKLSMKSEQSLDEDGKGEKVQETYGYFLDEYGLTPTVIIIKDGKQVAGFIGGYDYNTIKNFLKDKYNNM